MNQTPISPRLAVGTLISRPKKVFWWGWNVETQIVSGLTAYDNCTSSAEKHAFDLISLQQLWYGFIEVRWKTAPNCTHQESIWTAWQLILETSRTGPKRSTCGNCPRSKHEDVSFPGGGHVINWCVQPYSCVSAVPVQYLAVPVLEYIIPRLDQSDS